VACRKEKLSCNNANEGRIKEKEKEKEKEKKLNTIIMHRL